MDVAIVTGAASGVGLTIARHLIDLGMRVYGLGGNYTETPYQNDHFVAIPCDLSDAAQVEARVRSILEKEESVFLLVNNAKRFLNKPFDACSAAEMDSVLKINLLCPLLLIRMLLPGLCRLRGYIINITVTQMDLSRGGPVGAAASGGLRWMSDLLFEELRENGVKVTNIFPQPNRARPDLPRQNPPLENPTSIIDPEVVAEAVVDIINTKSGNIISELILRPQRYVERPVPPPVVIPYPQPSRELEVQPFTPATAKALLQSAEKARREAEEEEWAEREAERLRMLEERRQREEERRRRQEEKRLLEEERRRQAEEIRRREEEELYRRSLQPEFQDEDFDDSDEETDEREESTDLPSRDAVEGAPQDEDQAGEMAGDSSEEEWAERATTEGTSPGESEGGQEKGAEQDQSTTSASRLPPRKHRMTDEEYLQWKSERDRIRSERRAFHEANRKRKEEKRLQHQERLQATRFGRLKPDAEPKASGSSSAPSDDSGSSAMPGETPAPETTAEEAPPISADPPPEPASSHPSEPATAPLDQPSPEEAATGETHRTSAPELPEMEESSSGVRDRQPDSQPTPEVDHVAISEAADTGPASAPLPPPSDPSSPGDNDRESAMVVHSESNREPPSPPEVPSSEPENHLSDEENDEHQAKGSGPNHNLPPVKAKKKRRNR